MSEMDLPVSSTTSCSENLVIFKQEPDFGPPIKEEIFEHVHIKQEEGLDLYQPNEPLVKLEELFKSEEMDSQEFLDDLSKQQIEIKNEYEISSSRSLAKERRKFEQNEIGSSDIERNSIKDEIYKCLSCDFQTVYKESIDRHCLSHYIPEMDTTCQIDPSLFETMYESSLLGQDNTLKESQMQLWSELTSPLEHINTKEAETNKCPQCEFQTMNKYDLDQHILYHISRPEIQLHKREELDYLDSLKNQGPVEIHKCSQCSYESKEGWKLKRHLLKHKNGKEVHIFYCNDCDYKTTEKGHLKRHVLRHKNPEQVYLYKCNDCDYQSVDKSYLLSHLVRHMNPAEVTMYKCLECPFQTKRKKDLNMHVRHHKNPEEIEMHKCTECDYQSMNKGNLKRHMVRHQNPQDVCTYNCTQCDYKTTDKSHLKRHFRRHKDTEKAQMHSCTKCRYQTTDKSAFDAHLRRHKESEKGPKRSRLMNMIIKRYGNKGFK